MKPFPTATKNILFALSAELAQQRFDEAPGSFVEAIFSTNGGDLTEHFSKRWDAVLEQGSSQVATIKQWFGTGPGEKAGMVDGLNLFFGALLGANLGTMQGMSLSEYIKLITLLAGTVITLRMFSTSERRGRMVVVAAIYAALIAAVLLVPGMQPRGLASSDLHRLAATLGVWVLFVLVAELSPMREEKEPDR